MEPAVYVATCITECYKDLGVPFLRMLSDNVRSAELVCVTYKWDAGYAHDPSSLRSQLPRINFRHLGRHWSESMNMVQHGRWLEAMPFVRPEDIVVLSDADIDVQRDFSPEEIARLHSYDDETFGLGWNQGEGDDCYREAGRITFRYYDGQPWGIEYYGGEAGLKKTPCYNFGVAAARASAWARLRDNYESDCLHYFPFSEHRSRNQFLLNVALHRCRFKVDVLPMTLHCHGHFGPPPGAELKTEPDGSRRAYYNGRLVMFRHKM